MQQLEGVISVCVDSKANDCLRLVHVALQKSSLLVMLQCYRYVVIGRCKGSIHTPGENCFRVGVNSTVTRDHRLLQNTGGGKL